MAFLIPDNLKSRKDVPESVRRIASAFEIGLDESVTVWFEPPFDPSGSKPHFVLLLPDRGIVVLEHLEAKSSSAVLGAVRGKLRLLRGEREVEVDSPLERAEAFTRTLEERIAADPRLRELGVPVAAGAIFHLLTPDELESKGLTDSIPAERCLFRDDLDAAIAGAGEARLLRALTRMLGGATLTLDDPDLEKRLRRVLQPETRIGRRKPVAAGSRAGASGEPTARSLPLFRTSDEPDVVAVMDRRQEAMAKSMGGGHRVIRGVAGSGKTLILVYRAQLLARLHPRRSFLVTCFTRSLAAQLKEILAEHPNVEVANLDKLMHRVLHGAGQEPPSYGRDRTGEAIAAAALEAIAEVPRPRYSAVLLDEAQDFSTHALRFALALLEDESDDFVLVADSAQNIFRRDFSWKSVGIQAQGRTRILRRNYRNTREILEFAHRFLLAGGDLRADEAPDPEDEAAIIPPETALRSGPPPDLLVGDDRGSEIATIVDRVKRWIGNSAEPRSTAVLYTGIDDGRAFRVQKALTEAGVAVFWMTDPNERSNRDRLTTATEPVVLTTVHSAKGLEFPHVLFFTTGEGRLDTSARMLAYVAMTRAVDELTVVVSPRHPWLGDLRGALQGLSAE